MAQLGEAIARYHKLLEQPAYRDLSWAQELQERMRERGLWESGRLVTPVLRPHFVSRRQVETLARVSERFAAILDQVEALALQSPALLNRLQMLPAEKMLAAVPSAYSRFSVTSQMDAQVQNGSLSLRGLEACRPAGLAYSEPLADLFLDLPIVKALKRGRYKLSKVGAAKYLPAAVLQAWKEFGGRRAPNIAVLQPGQQLDSDSAEGGLLVELFNQGGAASRIVSADELEYTNGKLRAGDFPIDLVFRRLLTRELLVHFDLSHPLLLAYRDRAVCVINDFRSEIAQRRALFDLVTDESITASLPVADRRLIRDFVPWTRVVAQKKTKYKEKDVDLPEFIRRKRAQLVLRPNEDTSDQTAFVGADMNESAWERALRIALRIPYVVQERFSSAPQIFPIYQYGELQMKQAEVSVQPHVFNGRMQGASAALHVSSAAGATPLAIAPVLLLEQN